MTLSTKPYFIRALYDWCCDSGYTPYVQVWVNEHTRVPLHYVQNQQITLSISQNATKNLLIDQDWMTFHARFSGVVEQIEIPMGHIQAIFAKETGEGMAFEIEAWQPEQSATNDSNTSQSKSTDTTHKKGLKLVK